MSLPDTVFIFVLALIIFGPKKLPEIGRQLGKLVGEFRRASNEFKFQIEEELRQAELADRNTIAPAKKELETPIPAETSGEKPFSAADETFSEETLPVGQYPNIDTVQPQDLNAAESPETGASSDSTQVSTARVHAADELATNPAVGSEPRTSHPYGAGPAADAESHANHAGSESSATSLPNHEPADPYAAPAVADVTHG